jgi:hypothetical protein
MSNPLHQSAPPTAPIDAPKLDHLHIIGIAREHQEPLFIAPQEA